MGRWRLRPCCSVPIATQRHRGAGHHLRAKRHLQRYISLHREGLVSLRFSVIPYQFTLAEEPVAKPASSDGACGYPAVLTLGESSGDPNPDPIGDSDEDPVRSLDRTASSGGKDLITPDRSSQRGCSCGSVSEPCKRLARRASRSWRGRANRAAC